MSAAAPVGLTPSRPSNPRARASTFCAWPADPVNRGPLTPTLTGPHSAPGDHMPVVRGAAAMLRPRRIADPHLPAPTHRPLRRSATSLPETPAAPETALGPHFRQVAYARCSLDDRRMSWVYLVIAGLFEIGWPIGLKLAQSSEKRVVGITLAVTCLVVSGWLLWLAQRDISMGTAYAVWTGIGAAGTFLVGIWVFGDPSSLARYLGVVLIIVGVATLKLAH